MPGPRKDRPRKDSGDKPKSTRGPKGSGKGFGGFKSAKPAGAGGKRFGAATPFRKPRPEGEESGDRPARRTPRDGEQKPFWQKPYSKGPGGKTFGKPFGKPRREDGDGSREDARPPKRFQSDRFDGERPAKGFGAPKPFDKSGSKPFGKAAGKPFGKPFGKPGGGKSFDRPFDKPFRKRSDDDGEKRPFRARSGDDTRPPRREGFGKSNDERRPFPRRDAGEERPERPFRPPVKRDGAKSRPPRDFDRPPGPRAFGGKSRFDDAERPRKTYSRDREGEPRPPREVGAEPMEPRKPFRRERSEAEGPARSAAQAVAPARRLAFEILRLVERGGHSTDLLRERTEHLADARDRALAGELVLGVLRRRPQLDFLIKHFSGRDPSLDANVRLALQLGIYQLRYLDRIPAHAAVDESVELVNRLRDADAAGAAGFVNAVLRKVNRDEVRWPDRATELCLPLWLMRRWDDQFGETVTNEIGQWALRAPESYIRVPLDAEPPATAEPTSLAGCYVVTDGDSGGYRFQDISSQSIIPLLKLAPHMSFLDVASAPGGKFLQALETPHLSAVACDSSLARIRQVPFGDRVVADATRPLPFGRPFDRILLDAPCSGTGTIGRNPEIRWRVQSQDLVMHHERQVKMLTGALKHLAPGGRLVYSTCSLEPEENEHVIRRVVADMGRKVALGETIRRTPGTDPGDGFYAAVLTMRS